MSKQIKKIISDFKDKSLLMLINGEIQNPGEKPEKKNILIHKDKIIGISAHISDEILKDFKNINTIDTKGLVITPGLIDQHIHGGYGCDFNVSSYEEIINLAQNLPKHGITSIVPTIMTDTETKIKNQASIISDIIKSQSKNLTKFLGIHLEGPCLCPKYKGIHPESMILSPDVKSFKKIESDDIKIVTYAPELDKGFELTKYLANKNIIPSAGHSNACAEEIREAYNLGLKQVTHLFNAIAPLHHRNPGIIGEALINDNIYIL